MPCSWHLPPRHHLHLRRPVAFASCSQVPYISRKHKSKLRRYTRAKQNKVSTDNPSLSNAEQSCTKQLPSGRQRDSAGLIGILFRCCVSLFIKVFKIKRALLRLPHLQFPHPMWSFGSKDTQIFGSWRGLGLSFTRTDHCEWVVNWLNDLTYRVLELFEVYDLHGDEGFMIYSLGRRV